MLSRLYIGAMGRYNNVLARIFFIVQLEGVIKRGTRRDAQGGLPVQESSTQCWLFC